MNRAIPVALVLIAGFILATPVAAADNEVSLGVQLWSSTWKETVATQGGVSQKFNNGTELMAGPTLRARFLKDWFASITYMKSSGDYESSSWYASGDTMKFERTDTDVVAGYLVRDPHNDLAIGFYGAYKTIEAPAFYTNQYAGLADFAIGTWKLTGPGVGLRMDKRLDETTSLCGNLAYYFLEQEFAFSSGGASRHDSSGWDLEITVAHFFTTALSANIGIRYQRFKGERDNGDDVTNSFSGLTGGIAYTF